LSPQIAEALRRAGVDATSSHEVGNQRMSDEDQLAFATAEQRSLVTRNARHFAVLASRGPDKPHRGVVICPSRYTGAEIGPIARALIRLAARYPRGLGEYDVVYLD